MKKKYNKIIILFTYLLGFYLLYTPNIGYIINEKIILSKHILIPIIFIALSLYCYIKKIKIKNYKVLIPLIIMISISIIYFLVIALLNGYTNIEEIRIIQNSMILMHAGSLVLLYNIIKTKININIYDFLFKIAIIQSIICIIMLIFPNIKELANNLYFFSSGINKNTEFFSTVRIYGITDDYTFIMPILHSILSSISLIYGISKRKKYILYTPIILLAGILNNRTSIIIFSINTLIILLAMIMKREYRKKIVAYIVPMIIITITAIATIKIIMPNTYKATISGFNQVYSLIFTNEKAGNIDVLINDMLFLPKGKALIFGTGARVYRSLTERNSDIGYINDVFMGGLVYISILYIGIYSYLLKKWKKISFENKIITVCCILTLVIANMKGECMHGGVLLSVIIFIKYIMYDNISEKKVSVIMATYKTPEQYLRTSIESILNQTYKNIELIIICDGAEEDYNIANTYDDKRIKCILNEKNMGLPYCLNKAISLSTGEYIARMDSDDISCDYRIEEQVRFLNTNPDIDVCGMQAMCFGKKQGILSTFANDPESITIQLMYECCIVHPTTMWRKKININYNEEFTCSQDFELWTRISEKNNIYVIKKVGLYYRIHEKQATISKRQKQLEMTKRIVEKNILSKKINNKKDTIETMLILSGVKDVTQDNYIKLSDKIDEIINNNTIYDKMKLKKILYNRYFRRMLNHNMIKNNKTIIIKNSKIRKKIINIYNINNIMFVIKNKVKSIKHKFIIKQMSR